MVTPILRYDDIEDLQEIVRILRKAGAKSDASRMCGVHIHIGANGHTAQTMRNLTNIMASHENLLAEALDLDRARVTRYCKTVDPRFLKEVNKVKPQTMSSFADVWYESQNEGYGRTQHYNGSIYMVKVIADRFGFVRSQSDYYDEENDNDGFCIVAYKNEGDFTELKKEIVNNKTLANRIDKLGFFKYMYLGDTDLDNPKFKDNLTKVKADLFEAIIGAIAIDSDWNQDDIQNSVEFMLQIEDFLADVDTEEERPERFQEQNAINTLKELAEHGKCSVPQYDQPEEMVQMNDGRMMWECTCYIRSWSMQHTAYATSKKEAKRYAAYLMLCDYYGLPDEFDDSAEN